MDSVQRNRALDGSQRERGLLTSKATVRNAKPRDALGVVRILARAFPSLYRGTFGRRSEAEIVSLLQSLYEAGHLSLDDTRLCEVEGAVAAVMILHTGKPIGRGSATGYWDLLCRQLGPLRAPMVFFGSIVVSSLLERRIPRAADLVYIEALAVAEPHRGGGLGSRLLADAEEWALSRGRSRLALHVLAGNTGARRLYARTGFRPWHDSVTGSGRRALFSAASWSSILMVRTLKPPVKPHF